MPERKLRIRIRTMKRPKKEEMKTWSKREKKHKDDARRKYDRSQEED